MAEPQLLLQRAQQHAMNQFEQIAKLDKLLKSRVVEYNNRTDAYLDLLKHKQKNEALLSQLYGKIMQLLRQIEELSAEKVSLSYSLNQQVSKDCQKMDQFLENDEVYSEQQDELEQEPSFQQSSAEEQLQICICSALKKEGSSSQDLMVMCEGDQCPQRWYHLKCISLLQNPITQQDWRCNYCKMQAKSRKYYEND